MERLVTINGISLYTDKGKFYSTHPKKMENLLKQTAKHAEDYRDRFLSMWTLEDIKIAGGINPLKRIFVFSSSLDESKCITILTNSQERAEKLVQMKFKEWGYKGIPILVL